MAQLFNGLALGLRHAHLPAVIRSQPAILLVDDEPIVRNAYERLMANAGYTVLIAGDGEEGLDLYNLNSDQVALIIADASMPVMGGVELARRIFEIDANARIIPMTGRIPEEIFSGRPATVVRRPEQTNSAHEISSRPLERP